MQKSVFSVVLMLALLVAACSKDMKSPTAPEPTTPSAKADVVSVKVVHDGNDANGQPLMTVTLSENLSRGVSSTEPINWDHANIDLILLCNGKESKTTIEYGDDVDPATRKIWVVFKQKPMCNGEANFRFRGTPKGRALTDYIDFSFPNAGEWLYRTPTTLRLVSDTPPSGGNRVVYLRGTPQ